MWKARLLPEGRFGLNKNALNTMRVGIGAATDDDTVIAAQWKELEDVRFRGQGYSSPQRRSLPLPVLQSCLFVSQVGAVSPPLRALFHHAPDHNLYTDGGSCSRVLRPSSAQKNVPQR